MASVAVVGGGISGLTAALRLQELNHQVKLFEASSRPGGILHTENIDGFLIDTGPDSFLSVKPAALQLARQIGLEDAVINTREDGGGTYILHDNELVPLPEGLTMLVPTQLRVMASSPLLSWRGKARMAAEYFIPARKDDQDEAIGHFVTRRLGRETYENIAEPLLSGIYSGDANELSLQSTFPRLREVEKQHGGIIRGALAQKKQQTARRSSTGGHTPFISFEKGLGQLVDGVTDALEQTDIRLSASVESIDRLEPGFRLTGPDISEQVDAVILATPAHVSSRLVRSFAPDLSEELGNIAYASTATVSLAYTADAVSAKGGRGFVVPRKEGRRLKAVTWTSQKFTGRAPAGSVLLRGFVGRAGDQVTPKRSDDEIVDLVRQELSEILGITATSILEKVYRFIDAIPQYNLGHPDRVNRIEELASSIEGLELAGNAFHGIGIPDCISTATATADRLEKQLTQRDVLTAL